MRFNSQFTFWKSTKHFTIMICQATNCTLVLLFYVFEHSPNLYTGMHILPHPWKTSCSGKMPVNTGSRGHMETVAAKVLFTLRFILNLTMMHTDRERWWGEMIQSGAHWAIVTATVGNIAPQSVLTADQVHLSLSSTFPFFPCLNFQHGFGDFCAWGKKGKTLFISVYK